MVREQFRQRACPFVLGAGENHLAHGVDPVAFKKHVLCAAEPDAFRAECHRVCHLLGRICICAHAKHAEFIRPLHQFRVLLISDAFLRFEGAIDEYLNNFRGRSRDFAGKNFSSSSVDGDIIASTQRRAVRVERAFLVIDLNSGRAAYAHFSHLPRNQGRMRRNAATRSENAFGGNHATQIFR